MNKTEEKISKFIREITNYPYLDEFTVEVNKERDEVKLNQGCFEITIGLTEWFNLSTTEGGGMGVIDIEFVNDIIYHIDKIKEILEEGVNN